MKKSLAYLVAFTAVSSVLSVLGGATSRLWYPRSAKTLHFRGLFP